MANIQQHLPPGTVIEPYVLDKLLSVGGFSVVYLAHDQQSQQQLVIKEYLPTKLAQRNENLKVVPRNEMTAGNFIEGRNLFLLEVSSLKQLQHPNIVNIIDSFSANDTVYIVMEFKPGKNLQIYISEHKGNLSEAFLRTIFPPLLEGLREVHINGLLHLDIKPGNIHIQPGGNPMLLDFGAALRMKRTRSIQPKTVITEGFSPIEQYDRNGYCGPWTDIYAIGATMRACIEGVPPPASTKRKEKDRMRPATIAFKRKYSSVLLEAIDWAMEVDALLRPQTLDEFLKALEKLPALPNDSVFDRVVNFLNKEL